VKGVDQPVNGSECVLFGGVGEMSVALCGGGAAVTEQRLDVAKAQALFKQVGCKGVPKRVN
jgi:hypothetical protein